MAEQIQTNSRQRELFIKKSTRVAASYLNRAKALPQMPDAAAPFFDVLENIYVKLQDISSLSFGEGSHGVWPGQGSAGI